MSKKKGPFRSGFVSLVGLPNAGKSTLLNALMGSKLAIVSDKPQTTRCGIQGVLHLDGAQVIFLDTPGIHKSDNAFNRKMMEAVREALDERDLIVYVADATRRFSDDHREALAMVKKLETPVFVALNKVDRVRPKEALLPLMAAYREELPRAEVYPISAALGEGLAELQDAIRNAMPKGPEYFPPDHVTDQPERFLAAEVVREKVLAETHQEVPHAVAVLVDRWEETPRLLRIAATVYVERAGQKAIVIGAGGAKLKRVGTQARIELESIFGRKVFLELFVKVQPGWRENTAFLNALDWRSMAGTEEN
jgi:GTP-binding protein Era